ncbi:hypothetical protein COHA_006525 [Chlorella ohadii]|uniref:Uncharacterized protein n=1 Tax=Chlorella ohadii TaxID=2649997 RepID=A0AAD5H0Q4_9CHLO|nr:hypothetical protein COHA_006525 [Chlorella ohadii]
MQAVCVRPSAGRPCLSRRPARPAQRHRAAPTTRASAAAAPLPPSDSGEVKKTEDVVKNSAPAPVPWWLQWLEWPQQVASRRNQAVLEAQLRHNARQAAIDKVIKDCQDLMLSMQQDSGDIRQNNQSLKERIEKLGDSKGQRQQDAAKAPAPPTPPAAGPWPAPSSTPALGTSLARTAAANASAAAAMAWASAAAGHEAAAEAAEQRAETQPAAHASAAATEWRLAAAAWRAAFDDLDAAAQADPEAESVQQAVAAVEAAMAFRKLCDMQE